VIDFFRNDIVWLVFYVAFAATVVERSITWLFFSDFAGGMTLRVVLGLWSTGLILGILFSVWLWLAIAGNTFRTVMGKLMICLLMLGLLCNWVLLYAVAYACLGLIDGERLVREPITCLYFSIVTWTTLGYGDVRPSPPWRRDLLRHRKHCLGISGWHFLSGCSPYCSSGRPRGLPGFETRREKQESG
jgi:Ion channel